MFEKILIAMGLSTPIWATIPPVRHLAKMFGSELHFVGISTQPQQVWDSSLMSYIESLSGTLQEENISATTHFMYGNPAVEVVKYCVKNGINLVVSTSGTGNEITCAILNNIGERMGQRMNIPVLMVPPGDSRETDLSQKVTFLKILVPVDCSQVGEAIFPYIKAIAEKEKSKVTLLHVNTPPARAVPVLHSEVVKISRAAGSEYVKNICRRIREEGIETDFEVIDGSPLRTILRYADPRYFDLIAMGTRGMSGISDWIFGSLTNRVSERAKIPVLTASYAGSDK